MQNNKTTWNRFQMSPEWNPYTMWIAENGSKTAKIHKSRGGALLQIFEDGQEIFSQMGGTISSAKKDAAKLLK
jgi:hypothetical protein